MVYLHNKHHENHGRRVDMGLFKSHAERHAEEVEKAHNDGQTDASKGEHHKPYDAPAAYFFTEAREVNEAYEKGHIHTTSQR